MIPEIIYGQMQRHESTIQELQAAYRDVNDTITNLQTQVDDLTLEVALERTRVADAEDAAVVAEMNILDAVAAWLRSCGHDDLAVDVYEKPWED